MPIINVSVTKDTVNSSPMPPGSIYRQIISFIYLLKQEASSHLQKILRNIVSIYPRITHILSHLLSGLFQSNVINAEQSLKKYDYTLQVGKNGSQRLALLNELINPHSLNFIHATVQLKNKRILDVGCGTGSIAIELANQCLPKGNVLATDVSIEQLDLAKENAVQNVVNNIGFKQISAFNIAELHQKFDIIYFRFLLGHLPNALEILQKSISLMHANSILICEEIEGVDEMFCEPQNEAFNWWKQAVQPTMISPRLKQQLWLGIIEISPILIASGFASEEKITYMVSELKKLAESSDTKIGFFSLRQISAKKNNSFTSTYSETIQNREVYAKL